ncbi:MAG: PAS domain S-box protein [Burkholderiales bacterium]|nr:PAS domain S-box protein [Burkholderiales bacterium]
MIDAPLRCGDGGVSWYRFAARRILLGGRNLIICSGHNVDVQRETEHALRASNALFSQIFDLVPEGLVLTDAGHRYQNVNRAWLARTGYSRSKS